MRADCWFRWLHPDEVTCLARRVQVLAHPEEYGGVYVAAWEERDAMCPVCYPATTVTEVRDAPRR